MALFVRARVGAGALWLQRRWLSPLSNIRVLDLSRVLAGPWATQILADFGAEVIKVEQPGSGDDTRHWGPPYLKDAKTGADLAGEAAYYHATNRNKKSITVDMASADGQALLHRIAAESDIVVENFKVGALRKYSLDYESLRSVKRDIIYASITGYGQTGPRNQDAGYDFALQGMGGLMSITGEPNGKPMKVGVAVVDLLTGMYATTAILAALQARQNTGEGQHIDVALLDVVTACLANQGLNYLVSGVPPKALGNSHPNVAPYDVLECSDGFFILAVGNDRQFSKLCSVLDIEELILDTRYKTNEARVQNRESLCTILNKVFKHQNKEHWLSLLRNNGVPCSPINNIKELFNEPQIQAREMCQEMAHPLAGSVKTISNPIKFSGTPVTKYVHSPTLGQHNEEILQRFPPKK